VNPVNNIRSLHVLALLLLLWNIPVSGQEDHNYNQQLWIDFNPKIVLGNGKVLLQGNLGYRTIFPSDWHRYYLNIGLSYSPFIHNDSRGSALQYMQLHAGIGDYYTHSVANVNLNEIRTYVGAQLRWPSLRRVVFSHRVRFEQRFERILDSKVHEFTPRLRYRLSAKLRFLKTSISDLYIPLSGEIFMNAGRGLYFNEVTRLNHGLGYDFTDEFATEIAFSYHFSRNSGDDPFLNNVLVYRVRAFYTF